MVEGSDADLLTLAQAMSEDMVVPIQHACCGFAGDRGMLHTELTASATSDEVASLRAEEVARGGSFRHYASSNRTCEIGMEWASRRPHRNTLELLDVASRSWLCRPAVQPLPGALTADGALCMIVDDAVLGFDVSRWGIPATHGDRCDRGSHFGVRPSCALRPSRQTNPGSGPGLVSSSR